MSFAGRATPLNERPVHTGGRTVVYWMQNSQRPTDNPALDQAIALANEQGVGVTVYFALDTTVPYATARTFTFLVDGLRETTRQLAERRISTVVRVEPVVTGLANLVRQTVACAVVTDLSPLRRGRRLRQKAAEALDVPLIQVDGDHVVPLDLIGKEHWAARTIRPVIGRLLPTWLREPEIIEPRHNGLSLDGIDLQKTTTEQLLAQLNVDQAVPAAEDAPAGPTAAHQRFDRFVESILPGYSGNGRSADRAGSGISPYLRFGMISPLRLALTVQSANVPDEDRAAFLEELVVRRELASNFVWHNPAYDRLDGLPDWARKTLEKHAGDPRPFLYSRDELAAAQTYDPIWNASQRELLARGRIHNYVRMYWGKKIIEWSRTPAEALSATLWLNDRFALDGRCANGFTNVLWCFGKHDRAWAERPVFGTIRWMSEKGMASKFDLKPYLARWGTPPR
jgi:deoxyribodipyrimidine photo-lyase